jgi:hypothetical protein
MTALVYFFLLEGEMVSGPQLQEIDHYSGIFFFFYNFSFLFGCPSVLPIEHFIVADAECN